MSRPRSRANCSTRANRRMNLSVAPGQCLLRVGFNETGHIDGGKSRSPSSSSTMAASPPAMASLSSAVSLSSASSAPDTIRPVKPHTAGPVLHLGGAH